MVHVCDCSFSSFPYACQACEAALGRAENPCLLTLLYLIKHCQRQQIDPHARAQTRERRREDGIQYGKPIGCYHIRPESPNFEAN